MKSILTLLAALIIAPPAAICGAAEPPRPAVQPRLNVLFISVDDLNDWIVRVPGVTPPDFKCDGVVNLLDLAANPEFKEIIARLKKHLPTHDELDSPRNGPADGDKKALRKGGKPNNEE